MVYMSHDGTEVVLSVCQFLIGHWHSCAIWPWSQCCFLGVL